MFSFGKLAAPVVLAAPEAPATEVTTVEPVPLAPPTTEEPSPALDSKHKLAKPAKPAKPPKPVKQPEEKKAKPPKTKPRASSASSATIPRSAAAAGKQPKRLSQDSKITQSLKDFRFPETGAPDLPLTAANLDDALASTHITLPEIDDTTNAIHIPHLGDAFKTKKTPAPDSEGKSSKSKGIRRKKLKLLPRRAIKKARGYAGRLKARMKKGKDKVKNKRPKGGYVSLLKPRMPTYANRNPDPIPERHVP